MTVKALRASLALTAQYLPGLPHPARSPGSHVNPQGHQSLSQWCHRRFSLPTALPCHGSPKPGPPMGSHPVPALARPRSPVWPSWGCVWARFSSPGVILTPTCRLMSWPILSLSTALQLCPMPWAGAHPRYPPAALLLAGAVEVVPSMGWKLYPYF